MKKFCLALTLLFALTTRAAMAQDNAIKINVLSPIVRTLSVFYEHKLSDAGSGQLGFFYTGFSVSDTKFRGFGLTPEYRYYLSDDGAIHGFYIAPFLRYQNFNLSNDKIIVDYDDNLNPVYGKAEATYSTFGGGVLVGYQAVFKQRITLDVFGGPGYNSGSIKVKSGSKDDFSTGAFGGFSFRTGLTLGVAF